MPAIPLLCAPAPGAGAGPAPHSAVACRTLDPVWTRCRGGAWNRCSGRYRSPEPVGTGVLCHRRDSSSAGTGRGVSAGRHAVPAAVPAALGCFLIVRLGGSAPAALGRAGSRGRARSSVAWCGTGRRDLAGSWSERYRRWPSTQPLRTRVIEPAMSAKGERSDDRTLTAKSLLNGSLPAVALPANGGPGTPVDHPLAEDTGRA